MLRLGLSDEKQFKQIQADWVSESKIIAHKTCRQRRVSKHTKPDCAILAFTHTTQQATTIRTDIDYAPDNVCQCIVLKSPELQYNCTAFGGSGKRERVDDAVKKQLDRLQELCTLLAQEDPNPAPCLDVSDLTPTTTSDLFSYARTLPYLAPANNSPAHAPHNQTSTTTTADPAAGATVSQNPPRSRSKSRKKTRRPPPSNPRNYLRAGSAAIKSIEAKNRIRKYEAAGRAAHEVLCREREAGAQLWGIVDTIYPKGKDRGMRAKPKLRAESVLRAAEAPTLEVETRWRHILGEKESEGGCDAQALLARELQEEQIEHGPQRLQALGEQVAPAAEQDLPSTQQPAPAAATSSAHVNATSSLTHQATDQPQVAPSAASNASSSGQPAQELNETVEHTVVAQGADPSAPVQLVDDVSPEGAYRVPLGRELALEEVILQLRISHATCPTVVSQEMLALGSNTLADVCDAIYCVVDCSTEYYNQGSRDSWVFVENVFYTDRRHEGWQDQSIEARKFAEAHDLAIEADHVPQSVVASLDSGGGGSSKLWQFAMEKIRLKELWLKQGSGCYLYCHQGSCEHVIMVVDVRLPCRYDVVDAAAYPLTTFLKTPVVRRCQVCERGDAKVVTYDDVAMDTSPAFACATCYEELHPQESQAREADKGEFKAFPYFHD